MAQLGHILLPVVHAAWASLCGISPPSLRLSPGDKIQHRKIDAERGSQHPTRVPNAPLGKMLHPVSIQPSEYWDKPPTNWCEVEFLRRILRRASHVGSPETRSRSRAPGFCSCSAAWSPRTSPWPSNRRILLAQPRHASGSDAKRYPNGSKIGTQNGTRVNCNRD